jgi:ADP-heptose:LPS heptosyltransferase
MKISKSVVKQNFKKYDYGNLEKDKYYISYLDIDKPNIVSTNIFIPSYKVYRKGVDLTDKKILIVTAFALGDSIHFLPVLKAIKKAYKGVYIGYEHKKDNKLLIDNPYIDELVPNPITVDVLEKFDYVFDLTTHVATVGFDNQFVPDYLASLFDEKVFSFYKEDKKPDITLSNDPEVKTNIYKIKRYISLGKPLLGLHFEASSIHRRITPDVLDIVLNYAKDRYTIVSAYTESAKELAKEYFEKYPFIVDVSSYVKDVEYLAHYVSILDILISAETSVAHIGVALGVPTLVVLGASSFESVYDYKVPYIKGVNGRYVGIKCSSPCRIHALSGPCPEAKLLKETKKQDDDYSPCFKFIDKIELLETFKSLEKLVKNQNLEIPEENKTVDFENLYSYYYKNNIVNNYIGRAYLYFNKFRHSVYYFIREFALKNKILKIEGYDKALYEEILEDALDVKIDDNSNNVIITDGFYKNIDFKSLKNKKAIILFANKNRIYNFVKKGLDIFDLGVVKQNIIEYSKDELVSILSNYFDKFQVYETPATYYEYESVFGKSNFLDNQPAHNTFLRNSINSLQGAFLIAVINDEINLRHHLDVFSAMHYEYLVSYKYKEISFYTKSSKNSDFDIVELHRGKNVKVFLAFEKDKYSTDQELYNFYKLFKELNYTIYTASLPESEFASKKDILLQTLSNIGIDIVFTNFKNLKQKTYLNYIASKIVFIDRETTYEDIINQFKDTKDKKENILDKVSDIFDNFSPSKTIYISNDEKIVEFLKEKSLDVRYFYGYFVDCKLDNKAIKSSDIIFLSECSIHKTYADTNITEFFIKKLSNFRTSLKNLKEDVPLEDLREYFYDYIYMGAYAARYNNHYIKHIGVLDFDDEMVFRVALSTFSKTRDFPIVIHPKDIKSIFNAKNIVIGLNDIVSNTLNKRFFEAFNQKTMFITDYKPILEDMFGKYGEYISGFSIEDIVEKANYFKENKQEAKEIINYIRKNIRELDLKNIVKSVL